MTSSLKISVSILEVKSMMFLTLLAISQIQWTKLCRSNYHILKKQQNCGPNVSSTTLATIANLVTKKQRKSSSTNAKSCPLEISVTNVLNINMGKPLGSVLMGYHLFQPLQCKFLVVLMESSRLTTNSAKEATSGSASQIMIKNLIVTIPFL